MAPNKYSDLEVHDDQLPQRSFRDPNSQVKHTHEKPYEASPPVKRKRFAPVKAWLLPAILAAVLAALVTGAAVGGGLGSELAKCQDDLKSQPTTASNSSTSSASSTGVVSSACPTVSTDVNGNIIDFAPPPIDSISSLDLDLKSLDGTTPTTSWSGYKYHVTSYHDLTSGGDTVQTSDGGPLELFDMFRVVAYTLDDCLEACSATYKSTVLGGARCLSITMNNKIWEAVDGQGGNCFLKNGTVADVTSRPECTSCLSAQLDL